MSLKRKGVPKLDERFSDNIERHLTSFHTTKNIHIMGNPSDTFTHI